MNINKRQQLLAFAALGVVGFLVLDKVVISPLTQSWKERSAEVGKLRNSISQGRSTLDRERITRPSWKKMQDNTLPLNGSAAEQLVLKEFDKWSQESRISVSSIKPQWKRGTTDDYSVLECRVDAAGSLGTLTRFLYEVENSPIALKIESVEITSRDNNGQQLNLGLLVSGLRLAPLEGK